MEKHTLRRSLVLAAALAAAVGAVRLADAAPTNDAFASATALTGSAPVVTSTNVGATRQSGEPTQGRGGGHTVWYSWTAPASGSTTIDTLGSALDTVVAVYTGSRVDRLTLVGYDDDTGSPTTGASKLTFTAASGVTYRIQVDGVFSATNTFTLTFNRRPPANDNFANARAISGASGSVDGTTVAATTETGEPGPSYHTVWYRWTAPATGKFWFTATAATNYYATAKVWSGSSLTALAQLALSQQGLPKVLFSANAGDVFQIQVDESASYYTYDGQAPFTLTWGQATPPANDKFANAQPIAGMSGSVTGNTWAAGAEPGEPDHNYAPPLNSIWYRWTAPYDEDVTFTIAAAAPSTTPRFDVYRGTTLTTLKRFVPDYDSWRDAEVYTVKAGDILYIAVDDARGTTPGDETLTWRTLAPYGDSFADPNYVGGLHGTSRGVNAGASKEPGEPNHAGVAGGASIWFRLPLGQPGTLTLDTSGSTFATVLAAYTGTSVSALTPVASGTTTLTLRLDGTTIVYVALDSATGALGEWVLNWRFAPDAPPNDAFANAQLVADRIGHIDGRTTGASAETGEPAHAGQAPRSSVWYRWVAPADGRAEFDTFDWRPGDYFFSETTFDTRIAVYRGGSLTALTLVAANDDWLGARNSRVSFPVLAGLDYWIAVDVARGDPGLFSLNWNVGPVNDDFAAPAILTGSSGTVPGTTRHASYEDLPEQRDVNGDVWYEWRAPTTSVVSFAVTGSDAEGMRLDVGTGPSLRLLTWLDPQVTASGNSQTLMWQATAGTVYRIEVDGDSWGPFTLAWGPGTLTPPPAHVGNDDFANAQPLSASSGSASGDTTGATIEPTEPVPLDSDCWSCGSYASLWYRWTSPATGTYTFQVLGTNEWVNLAAYGGASLDQLEEIASDGLGITGQAQVIRIGASAGETVWLLVSAHDFYGEGPFTLSWSPTTGAPANDDLENAQTISGAVGSVDATNANASVEWGEPYHAGIRGGASVWYAWTAPASGPVSFQTASSADTLLAVYDTSGIEVASNHKPLAGATTYASRLVFSATAGRQYLIAVDTVGTRYESPSGGTFTLSWRQPPTPPNDNFANAADLGTGRSAFDDQDGNVGATTEAGEPAIIGLAPSTSVWFKWSPAFLYRTVTVSTRGSDFDTVLAVYTGSGLSSLKQLAADDDSGGGGTSSASFVVDGSGPYWIAVDGKNGATGRIVLSVSVSTAPLNDHFENAVSLSTSSGSVFGELADATADPGQPVPNIYDCCASVWYRFTAPATGTWRFDLAGTYAEAAVGVYTGDRLGSLVPVVESDVFEYVVYAPLKAGVTYTVLVVGEATSSDEYQGQYTLNWRPATAPANDAYAQALTLSGASGSVSQSNAEASVELYDPFIAGSVGGASLWYRWTAPADGTVAFDTAGSTFDDVLGVYMGSSLGSLNEIAANDDFAGSAAAYVRLHVTAGTTYSIGVDGSRYDGNTLPVGTVSLAWSFASVPANDAFASAQQLTGVSGSVAGTTAGALTEVGEPPHGDHVTGASVWYLWTAPATGNYTLDTAASATPVVVGVYTGSTLMSLSVVRRSDDLGAHTTAFTYAAAAGATYWIAVDGDARAAGPFTLSWRSGAPPNDAFANPQQINGLSGTVEAATVGATKEVGEPNHAGSAGGASIWYRWTSPADGAFSFDTVGSGYDTLLAVYTGSALGALTPVVASDDADGATTSSVRFDATAGTTYLIAVDGKNGATGNATLNWRPAAKPANDDVAGAELIGGREGFVETTTLGASREAGEPNHNGAGGSHSVWYSYRAPASGTVTFTIADSAYATALGAYTGTTVSALTPVAQAAAKLSFPVVEDATYLVAVDGVGNAAGAFRLTWRLPPPNDAFAYAQAISGTSGSVDGTTEGATAEAADGSDANSVWFRWTAPTTGTYVFAVPALKYPSAVAVGIGDTFATRVSGGTWRDPGRVGVTQGVSYWIEVTPNSWTNAVGAFTLTWRQATDAPANDSVPNAQTISGASGSVGGTNEGASREPGEPATPLGTGRSVWFRWTAPASGLLSLTTNGSSYEAYLAAYTGTTVANLQPVTLTSHVTTGGWPGYDNISFSVTAGSSYLLDVDSDGYGSYRLAWNLDSTGPGTGVSNDMFANATVLKDTNGVVNGSNVGATKEPGEPNHAGNAGGHSVWYAWTAPASQPAGFQTACALDTLVAVYTGSSVSALTPVASNDNASSSCVGSLLSFNAVRGVTYHIAVDGKNGATGSFSLQWSGQTVDVTAPTTVITTAPSGTVSATSASFAFTSETGATFQCSLDAAAFATCTSPASYSGLALGSHTFRVRAADAVGNVEDPPALRSWTISSAPGNDSFASASVISGAVGSVDGSLVGATREAGDPFPSDAATVWYSWTAPRAGVAEFGAPGADVDAFTGSSLGSLTPVSRLPSSDYPVPLRFNAVAGTTYPIVVAGYNALSFRLSWRLQPANDEVTAPVVLSGSSGTWTGDNLGATGGAHDPAPLGERGGASIWFRWTAPATGTLKLDTFGTDAALDTIVAAYTLTPYNDPGHDALVLQGADDDSAGGGKSLLNLKVFEGTDYYIGLDGVRGATGNLVLEWTLSASVAATAPTVALTAPADGAHVRSVVQLTAQASDPDGIAGVDFLVNGVVVGTDRTEPYSVDWDTTTVGDGDVTVTARATDATSATAVSAARTLVVDNTPPDTTITSGPIGTVTSDSASFSFTSSEAGSTFQCSLDLGPFGACSSPKSYSGLTNGQHTFQVAAVDAAGNVDPSTAYQTWTVSSEAPAASTAPAGIDFGSATVGSASLPVTVTLTNNGPGNLTLSQFVIADASVNPDDFGVIAGGSCTNGAVLTAGQSCTALVRFTPTAGGARSGILRFYSNVAGGYTDTQLAGNGN